MKKISLILLFSITLFFCQAQRSEIGALVGTSFYLGDLNSMPFKDAKFAGGLVYRYNFTPRIALKTNILFGTIAGADADNNGKSRNHSLAKNSDGTYKWDYAERKLSFSSQITEISAQVELNFFNVYNVGHKNQISPYLFGGAAVFSHNPQAICKLDDTTYDLQPIGTEGQGRENMPKKYALTGFAIPFGVGFKANIGKYICVGAEWGLRFTFTDYLDDIGGLYYNFSSADDYVQSLADPTYIPKDNNTPVHTYGSQRYSTKKTDWYSFAGVILTVRIGNEDHICDIQTNVNLRNKHGRKR